MILTVVDLKDRVVHMFDSSIDSRHKSTPSEIKRMTVMLLNFLIDNDFYERTEQTDWTTLTAHRDPSTEELLGPQIHLILN